MNTDKPTDFLSCSYRFPSGSSVVIRFGFLLNHQLGAEIQTIAK